MKENDSSHIFLSINQIGKACGVSRTTLRRLDEEGLLKPYNRPAEGQKRQYDPKDVLHLCRILKLQECGLTHKEISDMLNSENEKDKVIRSLEERARFLESVISEMKVFSDRSNHLSVSEYDLPECSFYEKKYPCAQGYAYTSQAVTETLTEAVCKGFRLNIDRPLGVTYDDYLAVLNKASFIDGFTVNIPVSAEDNTDKLVTYPKSHVLSVMWFGTYEHIVDGIRLAVDETEKRHLKPAGPLYFRMVFDASLEYNMCEEQNLVNIILPLSAS